MRRGLIALGFWVALFASAFASGLDSFASPSFERPTFGQTSPQARACLGCGFVSDGKLTFCGMCGKRRAAVTLPPSPAPWACAKCKHANPSKFAYCGNCGLKKAKIAVSSPKKTVARTAATASARAMTTCRNCGYRQTPNTLTNTYCRNCGALIKALSSTRSAVRSKAAKPSLAQSTRPYYCTECGTPATSKALFCIRCGKRRA